MKSRKKPGRGDHGFTPLLRALLLGGLLIGGCGDEEGIASGRGVVSRGARAETMSGEVGPRPSTRDPRPGGDSREAAGRFQPPHDHVALTPVEPTPITIQETREGEGDTVRVRDPSAELRRAMGDPSPCLTEADRALGRDISFQIEVDVLRSGMVANARTTAPGVSDETVECVRRAAESVRFEPFEDGGRMVQTALILRLTLPPE